MKKKILFAILGSLCFMAATVMYIVGSNSSHLTELKDTFWIPIPLGIVSFLVAAMTKTK